MFAAILTDWNEVRRLQATCIDRQSSPASPAKESATTAIKYVPSPLKHYVLFRADLPPGFAAAQVIHAAGESAHLGTELPAEGTYAYAIHVKDEADLLARAARLEKRGVPHVIIREPDAPWCGQATALGIMPTRDNAAIRSITSDLPQAFRGVGVL